MKLALQAAVEFDHLGYGTFGVCLANGLRDMGVEVWTPAIGEYGKFIPEEFNTVVWAAIPGHAQGKWAGQYTAMFTMFETTMLPETIRARIHNFDLVAVPNDSNLEVFSECHPNVVKVPLGYDPSVWSYHTPPTPEETFRFLWCGAGAGEKSRKGSDIAVHAFQKAFPQWERMDPSPRLVAKCLRCAPDPAPFMEVHAAQWPVAGLVDLYRTCHAMVLPSRGEGWGYHPQQAVATGMPAIVSAIPGHMEYATLPGFATVPVTLTRAGHFLQGDAGEWWEPDVDATADAMRDVYEHYPQWLASARAGSEQMQMRFSQGRMAERLVSVIGRERLTDRTPIDRWETFDERLFPLEVTRRLRSDECTVGDTSYAFEPGERYWVPSYVKQVVIDAGYAANAGEYHPGRMSDEVPA